MFYTQEELKSLTRKDLQKLCKQFGIKANKKNCELVDDLVDYFAKLQDEAKTLKENLELKEWMSEDEELVTKTTTEVEQQKQVEENDETLGSNSQNMKEELMKEVEKRAYENLSKIPRFCADSVTVSSCLMSPATQKLKNSQKKQFKQMDSIDVYLEKKRKRTAYQMNYHLKLKNQAEENLKKMKISHNTPRQDTSTVTTRKSKGNTPLPNRKKSLNTTTNSAQTFKVNKEVTFNFVSKLKSPKPILTNASNKSVLKEKNTNATDTRKTGKGGVVAATKDTRKSVQFSKTDRRKSALLTANEDTKSPAMKFGTSQSSSATKKTPAKFDLKASLNKRLSYKPHAGKLKETYCNGGGGSQSTSFNANSTFTVASSHKSVKEITKAKPTRTNRRNEAAKRRDNKRTDALSKRRGIVA